MAKQKITTIQTTNPYMFFAYQNAGQTPSASTWTKVNLQATDYNYGNAFSTANSRFTAAVKGIYHFDAHIETNTTSGGRFITAIYKNGSEHVFGTDQSTANFQGAVAVDDPELNVGDYIEFWFWMQTAQATDASLRRTFLSGYLVSPT